MMVVFYSPKSVVRYLNLSRRGKDERHFRKSV